MILSVSKLLILAHVSPSVAKRLVSLQAVQHIESGVTDSICVRDQLETANLECILCDMDGTLLNDDHKPNKCSLDAMERIHRKGFRIVPATGRSRKSMNDATNGFFANLYNVPREKVAGVYSQGLQVYGFDGSLVFERFLERDIIGLAADVCIRHNLALVAFAGDRIFCKKRSYFTDIIARHNEPIPVEFPSGLERIEELMRVKVNKLLILADESYLNQVRPSITLALKGVASITTAVPGQLEILPLGASKGAGVQKLLEYERIDPAHAMAFGDGENDVEMLQLVGISVAMSNARKSLFDVADIVTLSNNEGGVGHVLDILYKKYKT